MDALRVAARHGHREMVPGAVGHRRLRAVVGVAAGVGELQPQLAVVHEEVVAGAAGVVALVEDRLDAGARRGGAQPPFERQVAGAELQRPGGGDLDVARGAVERRGAVHLASDRLLPCAPCRPFQRADGGGAAVLRAKEVSGD